MAIIGLAFVSVELSLASVPNAAIQYWYLNFSPLILAAYRFGLRGALIGAVVSMIAVILFYRSALDWAAFDLNTFDNAVQTVAGTASSPAELRDLALRVADIRTRDPKADFLRATTGSVLLVVSSLLVGVMSDRSKLRETEYAALERLRRYLSPGVADAIISGKEQLGLASSRKELTVLFADLRGFTGLAEQMEPEELSRLLNQYLSAMTEVIFRHGGTLDKYIGDGVMAFFGDPVALDDHEERAIKAALEMRGRFYELRSMWYMEGRENVGLGIGLHSGYVTVGSFGSGGRMEYTCIGSNVNLASRFSDMAEPGQILCSQHSFGAAQYLIEARAVGSVQVPGLGHAVEVVEILGYRLVPGRRDGTENLDKNPLEEVMERVVEDPTYRAWVMRTHEKDLTDQGLGPQEAAVVKQLAALKGYPVFRNVSAREAILLMRLAAVESFDDGVVVTKQGSQEAKLYLIYQGEAFVFQTDRMGHEQHVATLGRGSHFGEMALIYNQSRNSTIRAAGELVLLGLDRTSYELLLKDCPVLAENVRSEANRRLGGG
ncbi:MAG: cyclic nucleotide-binding domain-containing protein [Dehalococcoidia bacterium]|nr:cyclic nucleotide-binding domain-containing protein [Dehalococcoidia bacterium]